MKSNLISKMITIVLVLTAVSSVGILSANAANNHTDTTYSFDFAIQDQWTVTPFRAKKDDSNSYMYCKAGTAVYSARVWAGEVDSCAFDVSHGYTYKLYAGNRAFMRNWAYEEGLPLAAIAGTRMSGGYTASGVWSPDSV